MCGINSVGWSGSGRWASQRVLVTHLGLNMRNWDQHTKSFAASKPGCYQDQRLISGPSFSCFLLPSWHPPASFCGMGGRWPRQPPRDKSPCTRTFELSCPGPALPCVARDGEGAGYPGPSRQLNRKQGGLTGHPHHSELPHLQRVTKSGLFCLQNTFLGILQPPHCCSYKIFSAPSPLPLG